MTLERRLLGWMKHHCGPILCGLLAVVILLSGLWCVYDADLCDKDPVEFTIYNDDYTTAFNSDGGEWEITQPIRLAEDQELYGVRLMFENYTSSACGWISFSVQTPEGEVLADTPWMDARAMLDDAFTDITFGENRMDPSQPAVFEGEDWESIWAFYDNGGTDPQPLPAVYPVKGSDYPQVVLHIRYVPEPRRACSTRLSVWQSGGVPDGMDEASINGQPMGGTLALQLMTDNGKGWGQKMGWILAGLTLLSLAVAIAMIWRRRALHRAFCCGAAFLGLTFALVTPPLVAPDEYAHMAGVYAMANRLTGQADFDENGDLYVRACDAPYLTDQTGEIGTKAYKRMLEHLSETGQSGELTRTVPVRTTDTKIWYLFLPQLVGVLLARAIGLGFFGMLLLARLCNLAVYLALAAIAIKAAPENLKPLLFCVGMLPMGLQLGASLSPDAAVLGLAYCLTALCMRYRERAVSRRGYAALAVLAMLIGPAKSVYILLVGQIALIPNDRLGSRPTVKRLAIFAASFVGWLAFSGSYALYVLRDLDWTLFSKLAVLLAAALAAVLAVYLRLLRGHPRRERNFWRLAGVGCVLLAAGTVYALTHSQYYLDPWYQVPAGFQENGDSPFTFSVGYIFHNLGVSFKLVLNSLTSQSSAWLQGMLGTTLGEPIVYPSIQVNWLLGIGLLLVLLCSALRGREEPLRLPGWRRWLVLWIGAGVIGLILFACITWTPINYTTIFGVQGRYFLPVLPMMLVAVGDTGFVRRQRDGTRCLTIAMTVLTILVVHQAFLLYCQGA